MAVNAASINPNEGKGKITPQQRQKLKHFVKELENFKGRHTELVTVYVPQGYDLNGVINNFNKSKEQPQILKAKVLEIM